MAFDRFMIAPLNSGLQNDVKPFLVPDDAYAQLQNAYVWRSRLRKRFGSTLMNGSVDSGVAQLSSRLRVQVGTIGAPVSPVPGTKFRVGQMFSAGDQIFTVYQTGAPAAMLATGPGTGTFNTTSGAFALAGTGLPGATPIYWYPSDPVMGLPSYESGNINNEPVIAFDTQFSYQYTAGAWARITGGADTWTGTDSQYFWATTYRGSVASDRILFVTNFNQTDLFRYYNGTTWASLSPVYNAAGDNILTARIIVAFKDRLLFLNTIEDVTAGTAQFSNRCRFSQNGDPLQVDAWREDITGKGGYLDNVATTEQIITCEFLKDRLIVFFERSTWELVYTGNDVLPFRWQQINTELGAESTFSVIPFDKAALAIANVGIISCNGANVERIDEKIPDEVFNIHNKQEGVQRVYGIRDYYLETAYWTFPSSDYEQDFAEIYPNRVLVYNYRTGTWAFNNDSFTCFGYYQGQDDETWSSTELEWQEAIQPWNSAILQAQFRNIIAGNQEGYICIIQPDTPRNAPSLQITNMTVAAGIVTVTAINHNLRAEDYVVIESAQGLTNVNNEIFQILEVLSANTFTFLERNAITGAYTGAGTLARVSKIDIYTKQYNFYLSQGRNMFVNKVDFFVDRTVNGEVTVDYFTSSSDQSLLQAAATSNALLGNGILETSPYALYPYEQTQERLWHPIYPQADGECIQLRIYLSDAQMIDPDIAWSDFELNAMTFYVQPTTNRMQ